MIAQSNQRITAPFSTAKNGNRLLQAGRALRQMVCGVRHVIHHTGIVLGHCTDAGDGRVNQGQRLRLLLRRGLSP